MKAPAARLRRPSASHSRAAAARSEPLHSRRNPAALWAGTPHPDAILRPIGSSHTRATLTRPGNSQRDHDRKRSPRPSSTPRPLLESSRCNRGRIPCCRGTRLQRYPSKHTHLTRRRARSEPSFGSHRSGLSYAALVFGDETGELKLGSLRESAAARASKVASGAPSESCSARGAPWAQGAPVGAGTP